jgi:hypothetical protein
VADYVDDALPLEETLATYARRQAVLNAALAGGEPNVLDTRNGYLRLRLAQENAEADTLDLVVTFFNQEGGRRLVVMQAVHADPRDGQPASTDYFWRLEGGRFTPVDRLDVLPAVTYRDFWGDHPLPDGIGEGFFHDLDATHVEWPRQGTTARYHVFTPGFLVEHGEGVMGEARLELFESRRFGAMELLWDRRRGVFTKGAKTPYEPEGDAHDHH